MVSYMDVGMTETRAVDLEHKLVGLGLGDGDAVVRDAFLFNVEDIGVLLGHVGRGRGLMFFKDGRRKLNGKKWLWKLSMCMIIYIYVYIYCMCSIRDGQGLRLMGGRAPGSTLRMETAAGIAID